MQRGWLLLSHLSLKTFSINRAITAYEKYLNALKKNNVKEEILNNGQKILEGLKTLADEYKKKHNLFKNKEDSKKFLEELMKKYVNIMFWEDLEKPFHKLFMENNGQNPFYEYFMKGMNANKST
jgi:deoxyxylulose-5-phosphate synthase